MMRRWWSLLLGGYLLVWIPLNFATELLSTMPSLRMRGAPAVIELAFHAAAAALAATAGRMVTIGSATAPAVATLAVIASGVVSIQSVLWSALPRNVAPGTPLPLVAFACASTAFWLFVVRYCIRGSRL